MSGKAENLPTMLVDAPMETRQDAGSIPATSTNPQFKLGQSHPKNTIIPCK